MLSLCQKRPRCALLLLGCSVGPQMPQEKQEGGLTQLPMGQPGTLPACWAVRLFPALCFRGLTMAMGRAASPLEREDAQVRLLPPLPQKCSPRRPSFFPQSSLLLEGDRPCVTASLPQTRVID